MIAGDVTQTGGHWADTQQCPMTKRRAASIAFPKGRWSPAGEETQGSLVGEAVSLQQKRVAGFIDIIERQSGRSNKPRFPVAASRIKKFLLAGVGKRLTSP